MNPKLVLILFLTSLAVVFVAQNIAVVEIIFLLENLDVERDIDIFHPDARVAVGLVLAWSRLAS